MNSYCLTKEQVEMQKRVFFQHIRTNVLKTDKIKLAKALNVSITTIANIEAGKMAVSHNIFVALYVLLNQYVSDPNICQSEDVKSINNIIEVIKEKYVKIDYTKLF